VFAFSAALFVTVTALFAGDFEPPAGTVNTNARPWPADAISIQFDAAFTDSQRRKILGWINDDWSAPLGRTFVATEADAADIRIEANTATCWGYAGTGYSPLPNWRHALTLPSRPDCLDRYVVAHEAGHAFALRLHPHQRADRWDCIASIDVQAALVAPAQWLDTRPALPGAGGTCAERFGSVMAYYGSSIIALREQPPARPGRATDYDRRAARRLYAAWDAGKILIDTEAVLRAPIIRTGGDAIQIEIEGTPQLSGAVAHDRLTGPVLADHRPLADLAGWRRDRGVWRWTGAAYDIPGRGAVLQWRDADESTRSAVIWRDSAGALRGFPVTL
jgi:hypothetical protein